MFLSMRQFEKLGAGKLNYWLVTGGNVAKTLDDGIATWTSRREMEVEEEERLYIMDAHDKRPFYYRYLFDRYRANCELNDQLLDAVAGVAVIEINRPLFVSIVYNYHRAYSVPTLSQEF